MKTFEEDLYQCDGFMAIKHAANETLRKTRCNLVPTQKQWEDGTIAVEHDIHSAQYECQICFPAFKDKVHT